MRHHPPILPYAAAVRDSPELAEQLGPRDDHLVQLAVLGDLLDLWRGFDRTSYRLSATFEVSTVLIDSRVVRTVRRVQERVLDVSPAR